MNIIVMRHGQAETNAASDFERALTPLGVEQARAAGHCLSAQGITVDQLWVSPYLRTQQTADQLQAQLPTGPRSSIELLVPESRPVDLINAMGEQSVGTLLLVSHQPLVSSLVGSLANSGAHVAMAPASMALLETTVVATGCAELLWLRHAPLFEGE